jgi:hypothetical protein
MTDATVHPSEAFFWEYQHILCHTTFADGETRRFVVIYRLITTLPMMRATKYSNGS